MSGPTTPSPTTAPPPVYVISGGVGASGEQVVRTALAQFDGPAVPVVIVPGVRQAADLAGVVAAAATTGGTIVHTLVDAGLRRSLSHLAQERQVVVIDLMGHLLARLTQVLGHEPAGQPGLYRQLHQAYFDRIDAIEFAVAHDDGRDPAGWARADLLLIGPSRVGKTPLSMYLAVQGWRVANLPLVADLPPPPELFRLDPRRVVGVTIAPDRLVVHRRARQQRLGMAADSAYGNLGEVTAEIAAARRLCLHHGFASIDISDRAIEASASEVIALVGHAARGGA